MRKIFVRLFAFGFIFSLLFAFFSCEEAGLGVAVDTEPPTLSIKYPPEAAIIKDWFYLSGTCSDDKVVTSVRVTLKNSNTDDSYGPFDAVLSEDAKSWSLKLNEPNETEGYNGWTYPDGKYSVSVFATDAAKRVSGEGTRSFVIDNTAPFMIIKSPGVDASQSEIAIGENGKTPSGYGANLKIVGTVVEDNEVSTLKVQVYNTEGVIFDGKKPLGEPTPVGSPLVFKNINIAGGTEEIVASCSENQTEELQKYYTSIYGNTRGEDGNLLNVTKDFYCGIKLVDSAKCYQDPNGKDATDVNGNETDKVYINDAISESLMKNGTYELSAKQIAQILNDSWSKYPSHQHANFGYDDPAKIRDVKEKTDSAASVLTAFSLTPNASPRYSVSGFGYNVTPDEKEDEKQTDELTGSIDQALAISVKAGRDGWYIKPETLKYYLFGSYDEFDASTIKEIYNDPEKYAQAHPDLLATWADNAEYNGSSLETYSFEVKTPKESVLAKKYYIIALSGLDVQDQSLMPEDGKYFLFKGSSNNLPPTVTSNLKNNQYFNGTDIKITGTAVSKIGKPILKVCWAADVVNQDESGRTWSVLQDNPKIATFTPIGDKVSDVTWEFNLNDMASDMSPENAAVFRSVCEKGDYYIANILVWALDADLAESTKVERTVMIDTTRPTFSPTDTALPLDVLTVTPATSYVGKGNVYFKPADGGQFAYALRGQTLDEGSGVDCFYYKAVDGLDTSIALPTVAEASADGSGWTKVDGARIEPSIPVDSAFKEKTLMLFIVDKQGNRSELYKYPIVFDYNSPDIRITSPANKTLLKAGEPIVIGATITEDDLRSVIVYSGDSELLSYTTPEQIATIPHSGNVYTIEYTIDEPSEKTYIFKVDASDMANGEASSTEVSATFDKTPPKLENLNITNGAKIYGQGDGDHSNNVSAKQDGTYSFRLQGTLSDLVADAVPLTTNAEDFGSGTNEFFYAWTEGDAAPTDADWKKAGAPTGVTTQQEFSLTIDIVEGIDKSLWLKVSDKAGNILVSDPDPASALKPITKIIFDYERPRITITAEPAEYIKESETLVFKAHISSASEIKEDSISVKSYKGGIETAMPLIVTPKMKDTEGKEYDVDVTFTPTKADYDGTWNFTINANNYAEHPASPVTTTNVTIDITKPVLSSIELKNNDNSGTAKEKVGGAGTEDSPYNFGTDIFGTPTLTAILNIAEEEMATISYEIGSNSTSINTPAKIASYTTPLSGFNDGDNKLKITLTDKAGNTSEPVYYIVAVDTIAPKIELKNPKDSLGTEKTSFSDYVELEATITEGSDLKEVVFLVYNDLETEKYVYRNESDNTIVYVDDKYKLKETINLSTLNDEKDTIVDGKKKGESTAIGKFDVSGWDNKTYVIIVEAIDKADKKGVSNKMRFLVDRKGPELTINNLKKDDGILGGQKESPSIYLDLTDDENPVFRLQGSWNDGDGSGTKSLYYAWTDSTVTSENDVPAEGQPKGWKEHTGAPSGATKTDMAFTIDLDVAQGLNQTLWLKATDAAGNLTYKSISGIDIDFAAPTIEKFKYYSKYDADHLDDPSKTTVLNDNNLMYIKTGESLTITTTVKDTQGINPDLISVTATGGIAYTATTNKISDTEVALVIAVTKDEGESGVGNGEWEFVVSATDVATQGTAAQTAKVIVDTVKPEFIALTLSGKSATSNTPDTTLPEVVNEFAENSEIINFDNTFLKASGWAIDDTSGVARIEYTVAHKEKENNVEVTKVTSPQSVNLDNNYKFTDYPFSGFVEGTNVLTITPYDYAGNEGFSVKYSVEIDLTPPDVKLSEQVTDGATPTPNVIECAKSTAEFTATVTEGSKLSAVSFEVYEEKAENPLAEEVNGVNYTYKMSDAEVAALVQSGNVYTISHKFDVSGWTGGTYKVRAVVKDKAGKEGSSSKVSILVDKDAPVVTILDNDMKDDAEICGDDGIYKANLSPTEGTYNLKGKWSDKGSGTKAMYYAWGTESTDEPTWEDKIATYEGDAKTIAEKNTALFGRLDIAEGVTAEKSFYADIKVSEGNGKILWLYTIDNAIPPNFTKKEFTGITIDYAKPKIEIAEAESNYVNGYISSEKPFAFTATVTDSSGLEDTDVVVTAKKTKVDKTVVDITAEELATLATVLKSKEIVDGNAVVTVDVKFTSNVSGNDGNWNFTVSATDSNGRSNASTGKEYIFDATKPSFVDTTKFLWGSGSNKKELDSEKTGSDNKNDYFKTSTISFDGWARDNESGVADIQYVINSESFPDTPLSFTAGNKVTTSGAAHEGESPISSVFMDLTDSKENKITMRPIDKAGNIGDPHTFKLFVDSEPPELDSAVRILGAAESKVEGQLLLNGKAPVNLKIKVKDKLSIDETKGSVSVKIGDSATATIYQAEHFGSETSDGWDIKTFTVEIPVAALSGADGKQLKVTITDTAKNTITQSLCALSVDTTRPIYNVTTSTTDLNGKTAIRGTSVDDKEMASFELYYMKKADYDALNDSKFTSTDTNKTYDASTKIFTTEEEGWSPEKAGWTRIRKNGDVTIEDYKYTEPAEIFNWKYLNFDWELNSNAKTNKVGDEFTGLDTVYILPVVIDKAGNGSCYEIDLVGETTKYKWNFAEGSKELLGSEEGYRGVKAFEVDLNADKPLVKIENLDYENRALKYEAGAALRGSILDDDSNGTATIQEFIVSCGEIDENKTGFTGDDFDGVVTWSRVVTYRDKDNNEKTGMERTTVNLKTGKWKYYPADSDDGKKDVYIYVKDNNGNAFFTKNTNNLYRPRIQFTDQDETDDIVKTIAADKFTYSSDSNPPFVTSFKVKYAGEPETPGAAKVYTDWETYSVSTFGGKTKRYVKFQIAAQDSSGVNDMKLTVGGNNIEFDVDGKQDSDHGNVDSVWETKEISLESYESGNKDINITPIDNSEMAGSYKATFYCDNEIPYDQFKPTELKGKQAGIVTVTGSAFDGAGAGIKEASVKWAIPKRDQDWKTVNEEDLTWQGTSSTDLPTWTFVFDGKDGRPTFMDYINDTYVDTNVQNVDSFEVPILFRVEDVLGNVLIYRKFKEVDNGRGSIVEKPFTVDYMPDAILPHTEIDYPVSTYNSDGTFDTKDPATAGRNLRITGSSTGNYKTEKVYVQLAITNTPEKPTVWKNDDDDLVGLIADDGLTISTLADVDISNKLNQTNHFYKVGSDWWGIKANGNTSWSLQVNKAGNLIPTAEKPIYLWIRACSIVNESTSDVAPIYVCGTWSDVKMVQIDADTPLVGQHTQQLGVFVNNVFQPITDLKSDMNSYISRNSGQLWLAVSAEDESGIGNVKVTKTIRNVTTTLAKEEYKEVIKKFSDGTAAWPDQVNNKMIYVPLDMENSGTVTYTIDAEEAADTKTGTLIKSFKIDNDAPVIKNVKGRNTLFADETKTYPVVDSNYVFNLSGDVEEGDSGFEKLVFYFYRDSADTANPCYLDPIWTWTGVDPNDSSKMICDWDISDSKIPLGGLNSLKIKQGEGAAEKEFTFYGKKVSGNHVALNSFAFKPTNKDDVLNNKHIKVGTLIYIGEKLRVIKSIDKDDGTVTFDTSTGILGDTNCEPTFVYGQVIDYIYDEKYETNLISDPVYTFTSGDNDGMPEKISTTIGGSSWSADMHLHNIPDGPSTLVLIAFDKAGNISEKRIKVSVANNAPRIAKLHFGTDFDNNDKFILDEFTDYNLLGVTAASQISYRLKTEDYKKAVEDPNHEGQYLNPQNYSRSAFKIKNKLAVVAEIVGENGTLNGDIKVSFNPNSPDAESVFPDSAENLISKEPEAKNPYGSATRMYVIGDDKFTDENQGPGKQMSFTFWDETDDLIQGQNSQFAYLQVTDFNVTTKDVIKPNVVVNKFFWTSASYNSLYDNSRDNGHIELENDLPSSLKDSNGGYTAGLPKVSGKIVVRGTAFDDTSLKTLNVKFGKIDEVASTYNNGEWSETDKLASDGWKFKVYDHHAKTSEHQNSMTSALARSHFGIGEDKTEAEAISALAYLGQDGHKVAWELVIDTEKVLADGVDSVAALLNQKLTVVAIDSKGNTSDGRTASEVEEDAEKHRPDYEMDVVPYVTKVWTPLAKEDKSNWSVYNRTALGHYPVSVIKDGGGTTPVVDTIYLYGFNLAGGILSDEYSKTVALSLGTNENDSDTQAYAVKLPADIKGGKITVTVGDIQSINNLNNNDANGFKENGSPNVADVEAANYNNLSTYCYNRYPNSSNNNKLTDDIVLDVWDINTKAGTTVYKGVVEQPVMSINPKNKNVGFAYHNGSMTFSMGGTHNGTQYSTKYWIGGTDGWTSIGFTYDALGFSYGVTSSGDIDGATGGLDRYRIFTDRWGVGQYSASGYTGQYNSNRIELIGQLAIDGDVVHPVMERERIQSSSLTTTVNGDNPNNTNVYLAYYDLINDEIRFKWGTFDDDHTKENTGTNDTAQLMKDNNKCPNPQANAKNVGLFVDEYGPNSETVSGTEYKDVNKRAQYYRINHINLIAGMRTDAPVGKNTTADYSTGYAAGEFVDIAAIAPASGKGNDTGNDVVVAVWWDAANKSLMYSYIEDPMKKITVIRDEKVEKDNSSKINYYIDQIAEVNDPTKAYFYYKGEGNSRHKITIAKDANNGYYYSTDANGDKRPLFAYGDHAGAYTYATGANTSKALYYLDAEGDGKTAYFPEVKMPDGSSPAPGGTNSNTPGTDEAKGNAKDGAILYKDQNSWDSLKVVLANANDGTPFYGIHLDSNGEGIGSPVPLYIKNGDTYEEAKVSSSANLLYYKVDDVTYKRLWRAQLQSDTIKFKGKDYDDSKFKYIYAYIEGATYAYEGGYKYTGTENRNGWATPKVLATGGVGEYCKVVVDGNGGIHVAAYDNNNTSVVYFYSKDYKSPFTQYLVDSNGQVGMNIGLDVAIDPVTNKPVPYITYYSNNCSRPKVAYPIIKDGGLIAGSTSNDMYTGDWEIAVIPTTSNVPRDNNHNNVGLWKDSSGNQIDSLKPDGTVGTSEIYTGDYNSCIIYGNGTKNAILGYATKMNGNGSVETAQKR